MFSNYAKYTFHFSFAFPLFMLLQDEHICHGISKAVYWKIFYKQLFKENKNP